MSEKPPVDIRINNLIQRWALIQEEREAAEKWEEADHGWAAIDKGISKLGEEVSGKDMFEAGLRALEDKNGYIVNLGWVLLGQPKTIEYISGDQVRPSKILAQVVDAIPYSGGRELPVADERSPRLYNFLQAINVLLELREAIKDKSDFDLAKGYIENLMRNRLTESHRGLLKECSLQPDMQGTEIAKVFG